ncbi:MAG: hypothetical protein ABI621_04435 [Chloroflexota bacterium]
MALKLQKKYYGKLILIGASVLTWLLILVLLNYYGYQETWELWQVPTQRMSFMDFRLIPGSAESFAQGYEPSVENPFDPNERIFNYPAFWRLFFYTGISQVDTVWISVSMIVLFFMGVFLFPKTLSVAGAIGMLLVIFSPASMLLYERGNVDLVVFFICAMIVLAADYSSYVATSLIILGSIVKLFPIFGVSVLLKESKHKFWWLFAGCVLVFLAYVTATFSSVNASWKQTMRGDGISYGTNVFVTRYEKAISKVFSEWFFSGQLGWLLKYGSLALALILLLVVVIRALRHTEQLELSTQRNLAAFRMGAAIYAGTFLLGNNWDYRLAFLVFIMPQLVEWTRSADMTYHKVVRVSILLVLLSCWHFWISHIPLVSIFNSAADSTKFWIILDEVFNWALFASLSYLLLASTPEWFKNQLRGLLPKWDLARSIQG